MTTKLSVIHILVIIVAIFSQNYFLKVKEGIFSKDNVIRTLSKQGKAHVHYRLWFSTSFETSKYYLNVRSDSFSLFKGIIFLIEKQSNFITVKKEKFQCAIGYGLLLHFRRNLIQKKSFKSCSFGSFIRPELKFKNEECQVRLVIKFFQRHSKNGF